jgi:hypothetical protein
VSARARRRLLCSVLDASGVCDMLDAAMPSAGRPRQFSVRTLLAGVAFALDAGRPAQLVSAHRTLCSLDFDEQLDLGVTVVRDGTCHQATYRQFEHAFSVMCGAVDPSPVPSFKGVDDIARAAHLEGARAGVDEALAQETLARVVDALSEASVPDAYKDASSSLAVDWTDHETWSRPRKKDDPVPSNDPDASWGHAKRNAPGGKDGPFFGYYAQVATMVADEHGPPVPELIRRIAVHAPSFDPAKVMAGVLTSLAQSGVALGDVLADCGYSNRDPETFAAPLRRAGAALVMDLHPNDRGTKGTFEGAVLANGCLYCPATPVTLFGLGPLKRGATGEETAAHDSSAAELDRYRFVANSAPDGDGHQRFMCPAAAGKVACALKAASLALSGTHPSVLDPPKHPERCCAQVTITVPPQVNDKTRQKHPYPGAAFRLSYTRRTAAERSYASLCDPSVGGIRRGWCRLFGLAKNTLMYALAVVVRNVRIVSSFERRQAEEERRAATGERPRRRRRRRHQRDQPKPEAQLADEALARPG